MRSILLGLAALATSVGCAHSTRVPPAVPAAGQFRPDERDQQYGRALRALQARGYTVAVSDRAGGIIATQPMEGRAGYPCGSVKMTSPFTHEIAEPCGYRQTVQIVLSETGEAVVRVNREQFFQEGAGREVSTYWAPASTPLAVGDVTHLQAELLAEILGSGKP